jgi:formylglycine-generating enzyme required for sulfatase activity
MTDMVSIASGSFVMGSDAFYPEERPAHTVQVTTFSIDPHPVTNAEFRRFVAATGYVTTAETAPTIEEFPDADPADLVAGSLVFRKTSGPVPLDDWRRWWHWTPGANWRAPQGPGSNTGGLEHHPVVHVSYEDALAYAQWAGKSLPSETEWEYAARGGAEPTTYVWGEKFDRGGKIRANVWLGRFPYDSAKPEGKQGTTPVGKFPANNWGLQDMIGNVWEWTSSAWTDDHSGHAHDTDGAPSHSCCAPQRETSTDSVQLSESDRRVMKGGSHLCAPEYCHRYRAPARQGQSVRSSTSHLGFRCVVRPRSLSLLG